MLNIPAATIQGLLAIVLFAVIQLGHSQTSETKNSPIAMDHSHIPIAVPGNIVPPTLSLKLNEDAMTGFNLELKIKNYSLIPPPNDILDMQTLMKISVDQATGFVEGHAHLYINGEKVQRLYSHHIHLPATLFREGINQISVSLNNHGHMYWTENDKPVVASLFINPSLSEPVIYKFPNTIELSGLGAE